jgi:hypothetical protein
MLSDLARDGARDAVFRAERQASRVDATHRSVTAEEHEWESTLADGVG